MNNNNIIKVIIIFLLSIGIIAANFKSLNENSELNINLAHFFPINIASWQGADQLVPDKVFNALSANELLIRNYINNKTKIYLAIVISDQISHVHDPEICYKLQGFAFKESKNTALSEFTSVMERDALYKNERYKFIYWYTNLDSTFNNRVSFFFNYFWRKFTGQPIKAHGIVILYAKEENYSDLMQFAKNIEEILTKLK